MSLRALLALYRNLHATNYRIEVHRRKRYLNDLSIVCNAKHSDIFRTRDCESQESFIMSQCDSHMTVDTLLSDCRISALAKVDRLKRLIIYQFSWHQHGHIMEPFGDLSDGNFPSKGVRILGKDYRVTSMLRSTHNTSKCAGNQHWKFSKEQYIIKVHRR